MNKTTAGFGQKLLACFLALAMALSLLPTAAFAAGEIQQDPPAPVKYEANTFSSTLEISFWGNLSYVKVISSVTVNTNQYNKYDYSGR